jgi:hypothetical protein
MFLKMSLFRAAKHGIAVYLEWDTITNEMLNAALNKAMFDQERKRESGKHRKQKLPK